MFRKVDVKEKRKKGRHFDSLDTSILNMEYQKCKYPSSDDKLRISQDLGRDVLTVHLWFKNKRKRNKNNFSRSKNLCLCLNESLHEDTTSRRPCDSGSYYFSCDKTFLVSENQINKNFYDDYLQTEQHNSVSNSVS